jgi:hypothetical protein
LSSATDELGHAWQSLCERIGRAGAGLDAEGVRHLARQALLALREELEHADPHHPSFHRYEEPWSQWGGPNPDNVYLRARIDPAETYRLRADVAGVRQAIFSLHDGDMHERKLGVFSERTLDQLRVGEGGRLEITISAAEQGPNWMPSHPDARILVIRQYQSDWERDAIASFSIECVRTRGLPSSPPDARSTCAALERAAAWVESSMAYWQQYTARSRASLPRNAFTAPSTPPGGAPTIGYGAGFFELGPDGALLIESEAPDADYWGWALHTMRWLESGDFASRQTSLNHAQAHLDRDGRVRIVAARRDPGVPNWIDVEDRPEGLLVYRYVGARTKPVPQARTVAIDELREHLPADHPSIDAAERRSLLARRRTAALRRYA